MKLKCHLPRLGLALALFCAPFAPTPAWARISALSNLFVFGDSLSDGGNSGLLTGSLFPPSPPYAGNRYSNGPVAVEYLWQAFNPGNTSFRPSLTPGGGTNFALGGATSGLENFVEVWDVTAPLPQIRNAFAEKGNAWQLDEFHAATPSFDPATSLFVVWLFPNDVFYSDSTSGGGTGGFDGTPGGVGPFTPGQLVNNAINNISGSINELAGKGARNFLVVNSPDLGLIPEFLEPQGPAAEVQRQSLSLLTQSFNQGLGLAVQNIGANKPELDITYFEIDKLFADVRKAPGDFGFSVVDERCLNGAVACNAPEEYLFWDGSHPTTAGHALIGQRFFEAVNQPVPGPLPAGGVVVVLGWSRRLRRRIRRAETCRLQASEPKNQP